MEYLLYLYDKVKLVILNLTNALKALYQPIVQDNNQETNFKEECTDSDEESDFGGEGLTEKLEECTDSDEESDDLACNCVGAIHVCSFKRFNASVTEDFLSNIIALHEYCARNQRVDYISINPTIHYSPCFDSRVACDEFESIVRTFLRFIALNKESHVNIEANIILVVSLYNYIFANFNHVIERPQLIRIMSEKLEKIYNSNEEKFHSLCNEILKIGHPVPQWIRYFKYFESIE